MPERSHQEFMEALSISEKSDEEQAKIHYEVTGSWPDEQFSEMYGDDAVIGTPIEVAKLAVELGDVPLGMWKQIDSESLSVFQRLAESENNPWRFKSAVDMAKLIREGGVSDALAKADFVEKINFDAKVDSSFSMVFKQGDEFLIWGPASVEIIDKENDKINIDALDKALPQLLKRASLSYAHTDQLVGRILERFETDEEVEVQIGDNTYKRNSFPTAVLDLDDGRPPGMFVAGEIFDDTNQSRDVRQKIEDGEIDSYSISGEALVTQKQIDGDMVYDDILEMDLSAVTVCEKGMNQEAKFARINGEVSNVEVAKVGESSESYKMETGRVSSPEQVVESAVVKSMTEETAETTEESKGELPEGFNPEAYLKRDDFESEIATKADLEETISKTVDEVVKQVEETLPTEEDIEKIAGEALSEKLPKGDLATLSYIEETFATKEDLEEPTKEEHEEGEEEEAEKGEDEEEYEEEKSEDEEEEDEEEEEEAEGGEKQFSTEQLKNELPGDVWSVVSEYIGDTKQKSEIEEEEPSGNEELQKAVAEVLEGTGVQSPGVNIGDRADELDEMYKSEGDDEQESPALSNWR